jgi:hypothetical protein
MRRPTNGEERKKKNALTHLGGANRYAISCVGVVCIVIVAGMGVAYACACAGAVCGVDGVAMSVSRS